MQPDLILQEGTEETEIEPNASIFVRSPLPSSPFLPVKTAVVRVLTYKSIACFSCV